jgi:hypothetical protein
MNNNLLCSLKRAAWHKLWPWIEPGAALKKWRGTTQLTINTRHNTADDDYLVKTDFHDFFMNWWNFMKNIKKFYEHLTEFFSWKYNSWHFMKLFTKISSTFMKIFIKFHEIFHEICSWNISWNFIKKISSLHGMVFASVCPRHMYCSMCCQNSPVSCRNKTIV